MASTAWCKTVRPAAAGHLAAREFVDDHHLIILHNVIDVALVQGVRPQSLVDVVNRLHVRRVVQIAQAEQPLDLADAFFRQRGGPVLFLQRVIDILDQLGNDFVDAVVLIRGLFRGLPEMISGVRASSISIESTSSPPEN